MTAFELTHHGPSADGARPKRISAALMWYVLLEVVTWIFVVGMVSTVSAGQSGSSGYTLAVAAAGIAVSFLRRANTRRLTLFTTLVELLTLFLVVGTVSNPGRNGLAVVILALAAWVAIEAVRSALWRPATVLSALGQIAILLGVGIFIDGRSTGQSPLPLALPLWVAAELAWGLTLRSAIERRPLNYRLTTRQKTAIIAVSLVLTVALTASAIRNMTTAQYYGTTISMESMRYKNPYPYCITYSWVFAGVNLRFSGFGGTTECFDTEAELRQAAETRDWVGRRAFSSE